MSPSRVQTSSSARSLRECSKLCDVGNGISVRLLFPSSIRAELFDKHCSGLSVRLENEHLGNIDQYRVTREVPLPYTYEDHSHESDGDEDDAGSHKTGVSSWRMRRRNPNQPDAATNAEAGATIED